jgi:hypothetical protein
MNHANDDKLVGSVCRKPDVRNQTVLFCGAFDVKSFVRSAAAESASSKLIEEIARELAFHALAQPRLVGLKDKCLRLV